MSVKVELIEMDHNKSRSDSGELNRITIYEADNHRNHDYETWWGELVRVRNIGRRTYIDLSLMRSVREAMTGKKGSWRFIRNVTGSPIQELGHTKYQTRLVLVWTGTRQVRS